MTCISKFAVLNNLLRVCAVQSIGRSSLQGMDVKRREEYTRSVSSLEGITSLASAVARTTPSMLNEVSKAGRFPGLKTLVLDEPVPDRALAVENVPPASAIIARIGDLERIIHLQVALTEHTKAELDKDAVQQEAAAASSAEGGPGSFHFWGGLATCSSFS